MSKRHILSFTPQTRLSGRANEAEKRNHPAGLGDSIHHQLGQSFLYIQPKWGAV
jgi:hypothetical protein